MKVIRILGLGGAGLKIASYLKRNHPQDLWEYWGADSDESALGSVQLDRKWAIGAKSSRGLGSGGDPELAREWVEEMAPDFNDAFKDVDLVFVLAGLGGGIGGGSAARISRMATAQGAFAFVLCALPFDCEGARRSRQARDAMRELFLAADGLIPFQNQRALSVLGADTPLKDALDCISEKFHEAIHGLVGLQKRPAMMELDLADIRSVAHGSATFRTLHSETAEGEDRPARLMEKLKTSAWLSSIEDWGQIDSVLVGIEGGESITMREIDQIMEGLQSSMPKARVFPGAHMRSDWSEKTRLTLLISCGSGLPWENDLASPAQSEISHWIPASPQKQPTVSEGWARQALSGLEASPEWQSEDQEGNTSNLAAPGSSPIATNSGSTIPNQSVTKMEILEQPLLPMDIPQHGRFEKSEPTLRMGEDLDIPTFIRRRKLTDPSIFYSI